MERPAVAIGNLSFAQMDGVNVQCPHVFTFYSSLLYDNTHDCHAYLMTTSSGDKRAFIEEDRKIRLGCPPPKCILFSPQAPETDDRMSGRQAGDRDVTSTEQLSPPATGTQGTQVYTTLYTGDYIVSCCHLLRQAGNNSFVTALLQSLPAAEFPLHARQLRL